jgi:hypothetical protein
MTEVGVGAGKVVKMKGCGQQRQARSRTQHSLKGGDVLLQLTQGGCGDSSPSAWGRAWLHCLPNWAAGESLKFWEPTIKTSPDR